MGSNKATIPVDGLPMASRVAAALADGGCIEVGFVGSSPGIEALNAPIIDDDVQGQGPAGGVLTALAAARNRCDWVAIAACDLPDLDAATVHRLVEAATNAPAHVDVVVAITDRRQPTCAVWRVGARDAVAAAFDGGVRALRAIVDSLHVEEVAVDPGALRNANHPEDLDERSG